MRERQCEPGIIPEFLPPQVKDFYRHVEEDYEGFWEKAALKAGDIYIGSGDGTRPLSRTTPPSAGIRAV